MKCSEFKIGLSYDYIAMATYITDYLKKNYSYLDISQIIFSSLILDYSSTKKFDIKFTCWNIVDNQPCITFSFQDNLKECGHSSPNIITDDLNLDSFIDNSMLSIGYKKQINLFNFI